MYTDQAFLVHKIFFKLVFFGCLALYGTGPWHAHAAADPQVAQLARTRIAEHIRQALPAKSAPVTVDVQIVGARGSALTPCATPWQWGTFRITQWHRVRIPLHCNGKAGSLTLHASVTGPVVVARQSMPKMHVLRPQDLAQESQSIDSVDQLAEVGELLGLELRRDVAAGQRLHRTDGLAAIYARKGERVTVQASEAGIEVQRAAIALHTARRGETLRARHIAHDSWVEGTLIAPGVLRPERVQPGRSVSVQSAD